MSERFREEVRTWLADNCPENVKQEEAFSGGVAERQTRVEFSRWFDACYERGWTVPSWPKQYGGAALGPDEVRILRKEMAAVQAPTPLAGMGMAMIGPTLLEYGTIEQKAQHLPKIASGEVRWCQGYSEPGAGSDLASLKTRAEDHGDYYLINGSKIWTSGADQADWIFCLVRTDPEAPKHEGISFILFSMADPGVTIVPIVLIAGSSPFCQCFFDDVKALKSNLIGQENRGWSIAKRLLQHERSSISNPDRLAGGHQDLKEVALRYSNNADGYIADVDSRREVTTINMDARAFALTRLRALQENHSGGTPTFATSMFKYYSTELASRRSEASIRVMGTQGLGWDGGEFSDEEKATTKSWLFGKALTIAGGSSEVQLNIIAKRVLGLPD